MLQLSAPALILLALVYAPQSSPITSTASQNICHPLDVYLDFDYYFIHLM